jgi:phosphoglucosamine mutase
MDSVPVKLAVKDVESKMAGRGRVLLRPSGTEPVVRVMVEGDDQALVARYAEEIADVVKSVSSPV